MRGDGVKLFLLITGVVLAVFFLGQCADSVEGDARCYRNFASVYTWNHRRDEMDKMWADRKLTFGECRRTMDIYEDAQVEQYRKAAERKMKDHGYHG